jgi:hypothetical protein
VFAITLAQMNNQMTNQSSTTHQSSSKRLQAVLDRFEITIAEAHELAVLEDFEIVVIADDSGSMQMSSVPAHQRKLGQTSKTRWDELQDTVGLIVELGACFDASGLDIFFLNRPPISGVTSASDQQLIRSFACPPQGSTPLTETMQKVAKTCGGEKPVLLFILTDGEPNGGATNFCKELSRLVKKQSTSHTFKVQIMACTADEDAVAWLNDVDHQFKEVDVTDDYHSEMLEVLKGAKKVNKFTRGDWCMKAMLGPVSSKFDAWDEKKQAPLIDFGGKTKMLEEECSCSVGRSMGKQDGCTIC